MSWTNGKPQLIIPKHHGAKLTDIPDDQLLEILQVTKKIAVAAGCENFNVLQNNGRAAHQEVDHVCLFSSPTSSYDLEEHRGDWHET
jgi:diadenosine tetraphosphate (Ap4A) HIT family hydrolase